MNSPRLWQFVCGGGGRRFLVKRVMYRDEEGQNHPRSQRMLSFTRLIVTLMPRFPFSAKSCAVGVSKARQSDCAMAWATPSWMLRGVASQQRRRRWVESSSLQRPWERGELGPVHKVLGLLLRSDELDDGVKSLLAVIKFLLLLEDKHEVVAEAGLHHHPVDGTRQIDVRR